VVREGLIMPVKPLWQTVNLGDPGVSVLHSIHINGAWLELVPPVKIYAGDSVQLVIDGARTGVLIKNKRTDSIRRFA